MVRWLHAACRHALLTSALLRHQKLWDSFMDWWISNEQELWMSHNFCPQILSLCGSVVLIFLVF